MEAEQPQPPKSAEPHVPIADHLVPFGGRMVREMDDIADELGKEDQAETKLEDVFDQAIQEQPSAVGDGVDLAEIKAVEPDFDPFSFRTLARETFIKIREARGTQDEQAGDGLLSPKMQRELNDVIDGDVAAHRHHVLSQLEVAEATIVSAAVDNGHEKLGVRFVFRAAEIERQSGTEAIVSDDHIVHRWAELWQFERDPNVDSSASDEQHTLSFGPDEWLFAHRGWVVTNIERLPDPQAR
jgi:predicted lipid-binding transport protein (Tim44 family)